MGYPFHKLRFPTTSAGWLRLLAYTIPVLLLLGVLYVNYLPFGYGRTFVLRAGVPGDRDGEFRLLPARDDLSGRLTAADGTPYRALSGSSFAMFTPKAYLRDARATADIDADGIVMLSPNIDFDPNAYAWDYSLPEDSTSPSCFYLDGTRSASLPEADSLVNGEEPFALYVEWTPESDTDGFQRIVGGRGFDLLQNKSDVKFEIGSTTLKQPIDREAFFGTRHAALAVYVPATLEAPNGYVDLYVDGNFSGRIYFQSDANIAVAGGVSLGKSEALEATYFRGCVHDLRLRREAIDMASTHIEFSVTRAKNSYAITLINPSGGISILRSITLHAVQD